MHTRLSVLVALALFAAGAARGAPPATRAGGQQPRKKVRVAVMEFRALSTEAQKSDLLSEVALTEASSIPGLEVIGRSDIESFLGFEKQKRMLGCNEDSGCIAEIGGALGVDYVLVGSVGKIGSMYRVDVKLVEAQKSRVRGRSGESVEGREELLVAVVQRGVHKLLDPLVWDGGTAPPPVAATSSPARSGPAAAGSRKTWGWVAGGSGLALVAGGAAFGLMSRSALDDEKKAAAAGDVSAWQSARDKVKSDAIVADVLFGLGAAGIGTGAYLLLTHPRTHQPSVAFGVAPTGSGAIAVVAGEF